MNLLLNCLLIGYFRLGPTGSAIATTTAEYISALSMVLILAGKVPSVDGILGSNQIQSQSRHDCATVLVTTTDIDTTAGGETSSRLSTNNHRTEDDDDEEARQEETISSGAVTTTNEDGVVDESSSSLLSQPLMRLFSPPQEEKEVQEQQQQEQQRITASSGRTTRTTTVVDTTRTVITPTCTIPKWTVIKPLVVASLSVFARSFMLQLSIAGAAAMATRGGSGSGGSSSSSSKDDQNHATSIAAHQIALQLWLLCSFICDALAAASQALVADRIGQNSSHGIRVVSRIIFRYALGLGMILAGLLSIGDGTGFLVSLFTKDRPTKEALQPLLLLLIVAQPLNSLVFAADGVLQGASAFTYQAKTMVLSVLVAMGSFYCLTQYYAHYHNQNKNKNSNTDEEINLIHVWYSLLILQLMRGITSLWKLVQPNGPIDLFHRRVE